MSKSKGELEKTVSRYGAERFVSGWEKNRAVVEFEIRNRRLRFFLPLPNKESTEFTHSPTGRLRKTDQVEAVWEQACRQRWRALNLAIKAKLEAVEAGITSFEEEFLAHVVMPNGRTVGDWAIPAVERALRDGKMPPLLPAGERPELRPEE